MTAVAAAAMVTAGVAFAMVVLAVMVALDVGIESQLALCQSLGCCVSTAGNTTVQGNACCCQRHLGTAADAAADQCVCIQCGQHTGQGTVAAAVGIHHLRGYNFSILDIINLELSGMAKVLEDHTVFISYRNSHNIISFRFFILKIDFMFEAGFLAAGRHISITKPVIAALDPQGPISVSA